MALALDPGDTFFDIGANIGWVTQWASWLVGRTGEVHAFEPLPTAARLLKWRLECLGLHNVRVNECGVFNAPGTTVLYEYAENFGGASSMRPGAWPGHEPSNRVSVQLVTLDDYMVRAQVEGVQMLKLDVQGAEIEALRGAEHLLGAPCPPILFVEVERDTQKAFGRTADDVFHTLTHYEYDAYSWRDSGLHRASGAKDIPAHDDVICLKPSCGAHQVILQRLVAASHLRTSAMSRWLTGRQIPRTAIGMRIDEG